MKDYNKIVESIHKGVSLALDDFGFNDESTSLTKTNIVKQDDTRQQIFKKFVIPEITKLENLKSLYFILLLARYNNKPIQYVQNELSSFNLNDFEKNLLIEFLENNNIIMRDYVNLDLPSRTLWCVENLGKQEGVFYSKLGKGSTTNREYSLDNGSYYIWSKITPNPSENGGDILFNAGKYYVDLMNTKSSRYPLRLEDDPAYNVNSHYRMPSLDHFIELFNNTKMIEYEQGILFVSKKNIFNFIFFKKEQIQYLTSELVPRSKQFVHDISKGGNIDIKFAKLYKDGKADPKIVGYPVWNDALIPAIMGHIRPIYIK